MGQREVIDWLIEQRQGGNDGFFSTREISEALEARGFRSHMPVACIRSIECFLEVEIVNFNRPRWRIKEQYVGVKTHE